MTGSLEEPLPRPGLSESCWEYHWEKPRGQGILTAPGTGTPNEREELFAGPVDEALVRIRLSSNPVRDRIRPKPGREPLERYGSLPLGE